MSTPGPGDLVVDRYLLGSRLRTDLAEAVAYEAHDQVLDRPVRFHLVRGTWAAEAVDAARRAALVSDPRVNKVLDAGTAGSLSYVVTEPFSGQTLTQIVSQGLVDEQQARAIAGEIATALALAEARGVHHTRIRPEAVRIERERVILTGLGLDGGLAGGLSLEHTPSATDARSVVALLYYAMTARWPGIELDDDWVAKDTIIPLPARRDDEGAIIALSTLVPHVDSALDGFVSNTFDPSQDDRAPRTAADVVAELEPWGEVSVLASLPTFVQQEEPESTEPQAPPAPPVRRPVVTGRIARAEEASAMSSVPPEGAPQGYPPHVPVPPPPPGQQAPQQTAYQQPPVQYAPQGQPQQYPAPQAFEPQQYPAQGQAPGQYPPAAQYAPQGQYPPPPQGYMPPPDQQQYYDQNSGFATQPAPRRGGVNPTPIVLGVVGVAVVAGLIWAITAMLGPTDAKTPIVGSDPAANSEDEGSGGEDAEPKESKTPETEARPVITGATLVLPEGPAPDSDRDHPEAASRVFDGDPTTFWFTSTYTSPDFGGSGGGSGVALTLQAKAAVTTFELSTNSTGGHVQIRATSADDPAGGEVVAEGSVQEGTTTLIADEPVTADSFVVWVTELPESAPLEGNPDLKYRIELNEVTLS